MRREVAGSVPDGLEAAVERVLAALPPDAAGRGRRFLLGIAGPPAAGKSTLAAALREALNGGREPGKESEAGGDSKESKEGKAGGDSKESKEGKAGEEGKEVAAIAGLDGFHFDDRVLLPRGHRPRKGAPFTFDAAGYAAMLERLAAPSREAVAIPVFDRDLELSRAAAAVIAPYHRIVITEGNYLLLAGERWRAVRGRLDFSVFLDVPAEELRRRLMARWLGHGYGPAEAKEKTEANDLVNARLVMETSVEPDLRLRLRAPG